MFLSQREKSLLNALGTRGGRQRSNCCRCEGVRSVRELLRFHPELVRFVLATERGAASLGETSVELRRCGEREFAEFSDTIHSQGVIAVAEVPSADGQPVCADFILALDRIGDPGNFGTMARTLRAVGQGELWCTKGTVDPWSDKSIRSGMGAQFGLRVRCFESLAELIDFGRRSGFGRVYIADPHGGESCFTAGGLFDSSIIVIGNEAHGVTEEIPGVNRVLIPMPGNYESLNAAQAATVLLFDFVRRSTAGK